MRCVVAGLVLVLGLCHSVAGGCDSSYIKCATVDKCVRLSYICDGDNDCGDRSDELICARTGSNKQLKIKNFYHGDADDEEAPSYRYNATTRSPNITHNFTRPPPTPPGPPPPNNVEQSEMLGERFAQTFNDTLQDPACPKLYTSVGTKCLSLLYFLKVGWGESRAFCKAIGGDLVSYPDPSDGEYADLLNYFREIRMTTDFWLGGRYVQDTEAWTWLDDTPMSLGTPYWAVRHTYNCVNRLHGTGVGTEVDVFAYWTNTTSCYNYQQAPRPDTQDLCAAITFPHYFAISDENCLSHKSPLCEFVPLSVNDLTLEDLK